MKSNRMARFRLEQTLQATEEQRYAELLSLVFRSCDLIAEHSDKVLGFLRSKSIAKLLDYADSLVCTEYSDPAKHYADNQLAALIRKYPFKGPFPGVNPSEAAILKFYQAEHLCRRYNQIFRAERKVGRERSSYLRAKAREWIARVIGFTPDKKAIWTLCGFGPGASVGVSGNATHLARKFLEPRWSVTPSALPYALAALRSDPHVWELLLLQEGARHYCIDPDSFEQALMQRVHMVTHNKIVLVPKTAKVHRTIAAEPLLNGYVQKGIDLFLRRCLYRHGIDLKDQSRNQFLAREGSKGGDDPFATIDLSSASDCMSFELVRDLLPPEWFAMLNANRSYEYELNGVKKRYHKFVSMGNGFCFPLETLIFSSVCAAVYDRHNRKHDFSVYGDDIIVRGSLASEVLKFLRELGFRHNPEKTFLTGPFRESCGADWFNGEDVRPITLDYTLGSLRDIFKFHNLTIRKERPKVFFSETREFLRGQISPELRYCRPFPGNVDTAFEVDLDEFMTSKFALWNRKTYSWRWTELVTQAVSDDSLSYKHGWSTVLMMAALRGSTSEAPFTKRRNTRTRVRLVSHHGGYSTWLPSPNRL